MNARNICTVGTRAAMVNAVTKVMTNVQHSHGHNDFGKGATFNNNSFVHLLFYLISAFVVKVDKQHVLFATALLCPNGHMLSLKYTCTQQFPGSTLFLELLFSSKSLLLFLRLHLIR